jgi:predicted acetyltransferase
MEEIRSLREEELDESFILQSYSLQYQYSYEHMKARRNRMRADDILGYFVDGHLASKLTLLPLQIFLGGKMYEACGISSVATWPEYRRQGMVGRLIQKALQVMREKGQTISLLHPFSFPFYTKYGWRHCIDYKCYEVSIDYLVNIAASPCIIRRVGKESWSLLNKIYEAYAIRYNGMLKRNELWWLQRVFEIKNGFIAVIQSQSTDPTGYIIYEIQNNSIVVSEMIFLNEESRKGLLRFIANHDSMAKKVTLVAPLNDNLPFILSDPNFKQKIVPYAMARIVDVSAFISEYRFEPAQSDEVFHINIDDNYAPWNHRCFEIHVSITGKASVWDPVLSNNKEVGINCDIQTFTAMMLGYHRPLDLLEMGLIFGDKEITKRLDVRISRTRTYLTDYF